MTVYVCLVLHSEKGTNWSAHDVNKLEVFDSPSDAEEFGREETKLSEVPTYWRIYEKEVLS